MKTLVYAEIIVPNIHQIKLHQGTTVLMCWNQLVRIIFQVCCYGNP